MGRLGTRLVVALLIHALVVVCVSSALAAVGASSTVVTNVMSLTVITLVVALFVWVPIVVGPGLLGRKTFATLRPDRAVLVVRVDIPASTWLSRLKRKRPEPAELTVTQHGLRLVWGDGSLRTLDWERPPAITSGKARIPYRLAETVIVEAGGGAIEYVVFDGANPLDRNAQLAYIVYLRGLVGAPAEEL